MAPRNRWRDLIMGRHALEELLTHAPERIRRVWTVQGKRESELIVACRQRSIPVEFLSLDALSRLVESDSHQSFVAEVQEKTVLDLKSFFKHAREKERVSVLMLDQIFDPQNLGSLLRVAECFGMDAVVFSKNRGADLTPVVAKASSGASELVPLLPVSNLAEAASRFQQEGFEVIATLADTQSEDLSRVSFSAKTVLILGSEGEGIQPLLRKRADRAVHISLSGKIGSLNVAQAAAIFMYCLTTAFPSRGL